tara:strand:- start:171 stop:422 length:252 start_codon:yes stop_codon:yes gene_type:complete
MKIIKKVLIILIKGYQMIVSPFLQPSCRYMPTCSEYFIESLKIHGIIKGTSIGIKRIISCHPIKFLGGGRGYDPVPSYKKGKK